MGNPWGLTNCQEPCPGLHGCPSPKYLGHLLQGEQHLDCAMSAAKIQVHCSHVIKNMQQLRQNITEVHCRCASLDGQTFNSDRPATLCSGIARPGNGAPFNSSSLQGVNKGVHKSYHWRCPQRLSRPALPASRQHQSPQDRRSRCEKGRTACPLPSWPSPLPAAPITPWIVASLYNS